MRNGKRMISILLAIALFVGLIPPTTVLAEDTNQSVIDNSSLTVEGTNGFGTLLSEAITEEQEAVEAEENIYPGGYTVTDLSVEGNVATVSYDSLEKAFLVVAVYTEDGMQMLASGTATVSPEETEAVVTIEGDMPEYFMASAYLLDTYDYSPLCASYDTPMYTREMQELLASTTDEYDADKVLNLDDDKTTNFAVYAETTKVIAYAEGVNTVISADDETVTYVIGNADESITSLQAGDVLAYVYGENQILIVKVASITVDGTTATITGDDLEMEEVFSAMKVEGECTTEDMIVDSSTAAEGITYEGLVREDGHTRSVEGTGTVNISHDFKISIKEEAESDHLDSSLSVTGSLKFEIAVSVKYYISGSAQYLEFKATPAASASISIKGGITGKYSLGSFGVSPIVGVYVGFEPQLELEFSGEVKFSATLSTTIGIKYDDEAGVQNISTSPVVDFDVSFEGTLFFGIDLGPKLAIVNDSVAKLQMSSTVGVKLTGTLSGTEYEINKAEASSYHTCQKCLGIKLEFQAKLGGEIKFLNTKWLTIPFDIGKWTVPLGELYYSYDHDEFGWGTCPYIVYRLTLYVKDEMGYSVQGAETVTDTGESWGMTNINGLAVKYVPVGIYRITTNINGNPVENTISITEGTKIIISPNRKASISSNPGEALDITEYLKSISQDSLIDNWTLPKPDIYLEDMEIANSARYTGNQGDSFINVLGTRNGTTDIHGNIMEHGLEAWIARWNFRNEISWAWVEYELNGLYSNLTGKLTVISNCYNKSSFNSTIEIIGDGKVLYSALLIPNMDVAQLNVDVTGIDVLRIYVYDNTSAKGGTSFGLWDFGLHYYSDSSSTFNHYGNGDFYGEGISSNFISNYAIFGGEHKTETTGTYILKTASFVDLVPGEQYVMLALVSIAVENPLGSDNLLYIDQAEALEDGTLSFQYVQRVPTDTSRVFVCGASNKNLKDAEITFPNLNANGELQAVNPTVVYDGNNLVEGLDYTIVGTVSFTEPGEYTCYIRGIYNYSGLVECQYTVSNTMPGDINGDGVVNNKDLTRLFQYLSQWDVEVIESTLDVNGDGNINNKDLTRLFQYLSGWDVEIY